MKTYLVEKGGDIIKENPDDDVKNYTEKELLEIKLK